MEMNYELSDIAKQDLRLVTRARNGDQKAYADLMNKYKEPLYFMILKMATNPSDADDLTIEAFAKAFKSLHLFNHNYAFNTWLFRIATNHCIDFIRQKKAAPKIHDVNVETQENITPDFHADTPDPEENLINIQKIKGLHHIISQLKHPYKTLIELKYFKNYSYQQIAEEIGMTMGRVKFNISKAKELLLSIIENTELY